MENSFTRFNLKDSEKTSAEWCRASDVDAEELLDDYHLHNPINFDILGADREESRVASPTTVPTGQPANESTPSSPPSSSEISEELRFSSRGRMQRRNRRLLDKDIYAFLIY